MLEEKDRKCPYFGHVKYGCNQYPNAEEYCIWHEQLDRSCSDCYCSEEGDLC